MKSPLTKSELIASIIRVNHAGEDAAIRIYRSQAHIFKNDRKFKNMIDHMQQQERQHLQYFTKELKKHNIRPTKLLPLWKLCSSLLGYSTALMGKKAAMAATVAVEDVISDHYQEQIDQLEECELKEKIKQFRQEEIEHHDIGIENFAEQAPGYKILSKIIKSGCRLAITLSKHI